MIVVAFAGDVMVRQIHDVKGIDMGNGVIRYKAEVDVDGRALAQVWPLTQSFLFPFCKKSLICPPGP